MNIKSIWKILNEVINRKRRCNKLLSIFTIENQDVSDSEVIANRFCDYFSNIGPNLAKKVHASSCSIRWFLTGNFMNSFFCEPTTQPKILETVKSLRSGTAAGFHNISTWSVKNNIDSIFEPLTHIVNLSIESGIVPDKMKIARVIPLFKSGSNGIFSNYRPVSV